MTAPFGISLALHLLLALVLIFGLDSSRSFEASSPIPVELVLESGLIETSEDLTGALDSTEVQPDEPVQAPEPQPASETAADSPPPQDSPFTEQVDSIKLPDDVTLVDKPIQTATEIGQATPQNQQDNNPALALTEQPENKPAPMSLDGQDDPKPDQLAASQTRAASGKADGNPDVDSLEQDSSTQNPSAAESTAPLIGQALDVGNDAIPEPGLKPNDADDVMALLTESAVDKAKEAEQRKGQENTTDSPTPSTATDGSDSINFEGSDSAEAEAFVLPIKPKLKPRALVSEAKQQFAREAAAAERAEQQRLAEIEATKQAEAAQAQAEAQKAEQLKQSEQAVIKAETDRWEREEAERLNAEQAAKQEQLDGLLADLDLARQQNQPAATQPQGATARSQMTLAEQRAIADDIANAWYVPPGVTVQTAPTVRIQVELAPDGSVLGVSVRDEARYRADPIFRAAADSMTRAVWQASPYAQPSGPYDSWRFMDLTFDLKDLL